MSASFRSQQIQDDADLSIARWHFDLVEGIPGHEPPQVRGTDVIAPGREGRYVGNRVNDFQELLVEGWIRGFGNTPAERSEDWHASCQIILPLFALDLSPGDLVVGPGSNNYLGLEADWLIEARTLDFMPGPIRNHMSFQTFSFRLEAVASNGEWWALEPS